MADAKGAGDVDDVRLRRPVTAEDLLRRFEDALSRERLRRHVVGPLAPLAVEDRHLLRVVALAGDRVVRDDVLDPSQVVLCEIDLDRAERPASRSRVRAPTSGTTSSPRKAAQAIAS